MKEVFLYNSYAIYIWYYLLIIFPSPVNIHDHSYPTVTEAIKIPEYIIFDIPPTTLSRGLGRYQNQTYFYYPYSFSITTFKDHFLPPDLISESPPLFAGTQDSLPSYIPTIYQQRKEFSGGQKRILLLCNLLQLRLSCPSSLSLNHE